MYEESGYVVAQRYSNWQKKKVRTIIVNSHAKNPSHKSIAGAIALAKPYDRIELTGGEYNEAIAIQMPLELVAADGEDPHIISRSTTLTITTSGIDVYMERLLVSSRSTSKLDAAVVAINGNPILYRCQCTSLLVGGNAVVHVDECTIKESSSGVGVIVQDSGGGIIKSTAIRVHRNTCIEIDTRGELAVTECTIDNTLGGDAMVISGALSSVGRDGSAPYTSCSHVEVAHCHFSVASDVGGGGPGRLAGSSFNTSGEACCIVLTQSAAPTIASNELLEGEIGILIEGPGTAQLKGNVVRCQRRCGILALVEEGFGYVQDHQTLRITGDNVLDRCRIGIDVQCAANRASYSQQSGSTFVGSGLHTDAGLGYNPASPHLAAEWVLTDELPSAKRAFAWAPVQGGTPAKCTAEAASFPVSSSTAASAAQPTGSPVLPSSGGDGALVCVEGEWHAFDKLRAHLQQLVRLTLLTYPTCLQSSFGIVAGTALAVNDGLTSGSANPFADILNDMLGTQLTSKKEATPPLREMLQLRGNKGIDIINTKFSNCDVCAIRFGRQGYGLVEECVFEDCGTYAIVIDCAAHPLITGCRFLRSRGASILVSNFANPLIIGNEMASGKEDGIQLSNMSRGLIIGNIIATHVGVAIRVSEHSQPLICANAISQNRKGGIAVSAGSRPTILLNSLVGNLAAQVYCTESSDAFICRNRISASADAGIHIDACSRCTVMSNSIRANGDGILVELDADPYVQSNDVAGNIRAGIRAGNNALGCFVGNRLLENTGPNVLVSEGATPVFRGNRIEGSPQGGVVVLNEGHGTFEYNNIAENGVANVLVVGSYSEPRFTHNTLHSSRSGCGVVCAQNACGTFLHNTIYENTQCGVYICHGADPTFEHNRIYREAVGVLVSDGGKGTLSRNRVEDCFGCGVLSQRRAHPTFTNNVVTRCQMSGLQVAPDSRGVFSANEFTHNDIGVHVGSSLESAMIELSSAFVEAGDADGGGGGAAGASATDLESAQGRGFAKAAPRRSSVFAAQPDKSVLQSIASSSEQRRSSVVRTALSVVKDNIISANANGGVLLDSFANALVENNDIVDNNAYGVRGDNTYAAARARRILHQKLGSAASVLVQQPPQQQVSAFSQLQTLTTLRANRIHRHGVANVLLDHYDGEKHETALTENAVFDAPHGMCVVGDSTVQTVQGNDFYNCVDGLCFSGGGRGHFSGNHIHECAYTGVYVADMGSPTFQGKNTIEHCGFAGVLVDVGGQGSIAQTSIRHCHLGVVVFCGPTTPFQMTYDELVKARLVGAAPTFQENTIEENELHGVLLLSVISGCPLRTPLRLPGSGSDERRPSLQSLGSQPTEPAAHDTPTPYEGVDSATVGARGDHLCALFQGNTIRRNRIMGVYHDRFEHWDLAALDKAHAESKPALSGAVKNAYGGYEILLGTSQVLDTADHRRQRQLKQVSFVENTITECSIGFGAGYGCHPYLERNKIVKNAFFGLLLRFGSAVSATGNSISENGLAGVYAASGAKGYIAHGAVEANNGWCRPEATPSAPRSFADCAFQMSFFSGDSLKGIEQSLSTSPTAVAAVQAAQRAYEQMTHYMVVLSYTMTDGLRYLAELVSASSAGLTLATGCVPAALASGVLSAAAGSANGRHGGSSSGGTTMAAAADALRMGGVVLPDYTEVCTADGGIGVWVQNGSRVAIHNNRIAGNQNAGVVVSRGVMQHHRVLHKAFHVDPTKKQTSGMLEKRVSIQGGVKTVHGGEDDAAAVDIFAVEQFAPALATTEPGAIFTPQKLCVTGILAAVQVAASSMLESMDVSFASFAPHSMSFSAVYASKEKENVEREQRLDSIHHAFIADNVITGNRDGVWLEIFHTLQASASTAAAAATAAGAGMAGSATVAPQLSAAAAGGKGPASYVPQSPATARTQPGFRRSTIPAVSASSAAGIGANATSAPSPLADGAAAGSPAAADDFKVMDGSFGSLDFETVLEGNQIAHNRRYGVYAVHVSTINCGRWLANRGALKDAVESQYEAVRTQLLLGKQDVRVEVRLPFELHALKQKVGYALLRKNDLHGNERAQSFVTSRQVAVSQDGDRTLLQMDTTAAPAASFYASQVLVGIPIVSALLQLPPPGVLLWEENKFHDGRSGVRLCGHLGPHSARFQRNSFVDIAEDAFLVEGHLACATVGKGNLFEHNGVSLRLVQQQQIRLVAAPALATVHRTRIFQNTFRAAKESAVLLECTGDAPPLFYRNEFTGQSQGTAALYLQCDNAAGAAVVQGNVFADSYVPVFLVGRSASGVESALSTSRILLLENRFRNNYIGAIVGNGAYPLLERNLFDANARAGLEVVGNGTRPQVRNCLFRQHKRPEDEGPASLSPSASRSAAVGPLQYPEQGVLRLPCKNFTVTLVAENARVLGPTSQVRLPAGLLVGPYAEPVVEGCGFVNNDVGVDAVRGAGSSPVTVTGCSATIKGCLFSSQSVCGVLLRGQPSSADGDRRSATASTTRRTSNSGAAAGSSAQSRAAQPGGDAATRTSSTAAEATVFEQCIFADNASADGCGDVVAMEDGDAAFRNNLFGGTVVGRSGAVAVFSQNRFVGPPQEDMDEDGGPAPVDAKHTSPHAAVVVQEGGRIVAERNLIVRRLVGVKCMPGAEGVVKGNRILQCVTGMLLAPFNRTDVSSNRLIDCGDCGVMAYGGRMADNEILHCPTGVVVQHSSLYKGINAVPAHKRDTLELLCSRNTITSCTGNGLLITTAGTFDSNNISHCKVGVSIVSPAGGGPAGHPPTVKNSNIYDNATGLCMENESEAAVKDNDVFDNDMVGVLVLPNAVGTLQGNRISSPMDQGAVEIPTEARIKSHGNVIRNQFSPAFQRGTRGGRVKEYQSELASLGKEVDEMEGTVAAAQQDAESTERALQTLQQELIELHSRSIADAVVVLAGPASRALRGASVPQGGAVAEGGTTKGQPKRPTTPPRPTDRSGSQGISPTSAKKRATGSEGRRAAASAGNRRGSAVPSAGAGSAARKAAALSSKSAAPSRDATSGATRPTCQVLIHVFSKVERRGNANAVGQVLTGLLAKPPLSSFNFVTNITTSTSQLLHALASPSTRPFLCVVVLDTHLDHVSPSDCHALQQLHDCASVSGAAHRRGSAEGTGGTTSAEDALYYTLVPSTFPLAASAKAVEEAGEGMSVAAYAAAHHLTRYTTSVEEVLTSLHGQISDDMKKSQPTSTATRSRTRSSIAVMGDAVEKGPFLRAARDSSSSDSDTADTSDGSGSRRAGGAGTGAKKRQPTQLTAEYVGNLLSQLTPEALGLASAAEPKRARRRKSSVANGALGGDIGGGEKKARVASARPRRGSSASKAGPASDSTTALARRRSSVANSKAGRRASVMTKKT